ncbi:ACT domain-containing protein [Aerococcus sp. L_4]
MNGNVNHDDNSVKVRLRFVIQNVNQLDKIIDRVKNIPDVYTVTRAKE